MAVGHILSQPIKTFCKMKIYSHTHMHTHFLRLPVSTQCTVRGSQRTRADLFKGRSFCLDPRALKRRSSLSFRQAINQTVYYLDTSYHLMEQATGRLSHSVSLHFTHNTRNWKRVSLSCAFICRCAFFYFFT